MTNRKCDWEAESCWNCGRAPYTRRDGRQYLYWYHRDDGSRISENSVCSPRCAERAARDEEDAARSEGMRGHD